MIRDPFYRQIEERLSGKLDRELFERCAADLLRKIHPTLVPIRGGDDAGMDGAIADRGGLPFPLVTTTGTNVTRNLRQSLRSYLKRRLPRRRVILATSQSLTSRRRENLEKAAQELGFTLLQIHDRAAFANLLYRDPKWCLELLGLPGTPPSLSVMPLPTRPLVGDVLVGRSEELQWLVGTNGDLLLVGQPGAGKTFLLFHFAKRQGALFVHTSDLGEIAAGVRSEEPTALIIDDAHLQLDLLAQLRRLRIEMGAEFRIVGDSWPGSREEVARALSIPSTSVRELTLLAQDEIAELVKVAGIGGPRELVQEIVNQAEGKPGLAITLCSLCLQGDVAALAQGDALAQEIAGVFNRLIGDDVTSFLAAFAVGGDAGMTMEAVAAYLGLPLHVLRERTSKLAAGGVLLEISRERLAVRPPALRHVLVREVFFSGATALPIEPLIAAAPDRDRLTATIIGAQFRGAHVPVALSRSLVEQCSSRDVWAAYARLGRREAEWIASDHPHWLLRIGDSVLQVAAELALPALLSAAVGDNRALNANPGHPMRIIGDWVAEARPGTPSVRERRRQLLVVAEQWLAQVGDPAVGLHALALSLSPAFSRADTAPGSGRTITFSRGFVTFEEAQAIRALWPRVRERVRSVGPEHWGPLREVIWDWAFHGAALHPLPASLRAEAEAFATEMVRDLANIASERAGFIHWAQSVADRLGVELPVALDPVFETLFPSRELGDWRKAEAEQREQANLLAQEWARAQPAEIVRTIVWCENEADLTDRSWPRWTPFVCDRVAELVQDPVPWLSRLLEGDGAPDLVQPFLRRILRDDIDLGGRIARQCLDNKRQRLATAVTLLAFESTPPDLLELALGQLHGGAQWVNMLCLRRELHDSIVRRLLSHPDDAIASAAAIGEWNADPKGETHASLREQWNRAVLRCPGDEWFLRDILERNPNLAVEWLSERFKENTELWRFDETIDAALRGLRVEDRRRLLNILPEDLFPPEIVQQVVGNDIDLYRELLQIDRLKALHLAPLIGHPNLSDWVVKAEAALEAGYSGGEIVDATFGHRWSWSGSESAMWTEWVKRFDELRAHPDERIRHIGEAGRDLAAERADRALIKERAEAIRGL